MDQVLHWGGRQQWPRGQRINGPLVNPGAGSRIKPPMHGSKRPSKSGNENKHPLAQHQNHRHGRHHNHKNHHQSNDVQQGSLSGNLRSEGRSQMPSISQQYLPKQQFNLHRRSSPNGRQGPRHQSMNHTQNTRQPLRHRPFEGVSNSNQGQGPRRGRKRNRRLDETWSDPGPGGRQKSIQQYSDQQVWQPYHYNCSREQFQSQYSVRDQSDHEEESHSPLVQYEYLQTEYLPDVDGDIEMPDAPPLYEKLHTRHPVDHSSSRDRTQWLKTHH
ncbi:hypothetical protein N7532_000868 [Penicillium argentinense]|uniref:Uncharacterized protein n=1 Tax=Penicillium argentinense TaxID=1131581 RepID=A0A9W9G662_9EURO|nr:uncharacterized protein N7532_000868 [Penicillium argentinense]KAJ5112823.1 hypothetical protein N7532_000868 [Penicillium argentinense]